MLDLGRLYKKRMETHKKVMCRQRWRWECMQPEPSNTPGGRNHQKLGERHRTDFPPEPADALISDFRPPEA